MSDKKDIHTIGSNHTYKASNVEGMKLQRIINMTEEKIGNISFEEIQELLKTIPEQNGKDIEEAVKARNVEDLGKFILMSIYQVAQDKIKKAVYQ